MAIHERVWERGDPGPESRRPMGFVEWRPQGTYWLLAAIGITFVLQLLTIAVRPRLHDLLFVIDTDWALHPWVLITSTLSHAPDGLLHIAFNGMMLYFFGPHVERLLGRKRFLVWFFVAGAIAGVLQVHLSASIEAWRTGADVTAALQPWTDTPSPGALGASGALLFLFGFLMILMPKQQVLLFFVLPIPFWLAGILFAALDILGAINPHSSIGNFAHLAGMALGIWMGLRFKDEIRSRGMRIAYS